MSGGLLTVPGSESLSERRQRFEARRRRVWRRVVVGVLVVVVPGTVVWQWRTRVADEAAHVEVRQEARAGDPDVPAVVWPNGLPDHGRWADDPWVKTMRAYALLYPVAFNAGDMSGREDLNALTGDRWDGSQDRLMRDWQKRLEEGREIPVWPGPMPFEVLDVDVERSGDEATVTVCVMKDQSESSDDVPAEVMSSREGELADWLLRRGEDGLIRMVSWGGSPQPCEISDVHYGLFDPQPARPTQAPEPRVESDDPLDLDQLMGEYDEIREQAERAARR